MAQRGGRKSRRLAGRAGASVPDRARWGGGNPRRHGAQCREQIYSCAAVNAASCQSLERDTLAEGISIGVFRDEFSLAAPRKRGPGQARDVFYPGFKRVLDTSFWSEFDRNAYG